MQRFDAVTVHADACVFVCVVVVFGNFWIFYSQFMLPAAECFWLLVVWVVCFGWVLGFSRPVS
ncbi:hypothetical protein, partial [Corynebacterium aquatimens]|uniref:hypothetical protein n=1 Tax=Corynebacterium aquatimens TaxID=1190508 RepID=UPI0036221DA8